MSMWRLQHVNDRKRAVSSLMQLPYWSNSSKSKSTEFSGGLNYHTVIPCLYICQLVFGSYNLPLRYEKVHLSLYKVADTPFHIKRSAMLIVVQTHLISFAKAKMTYKYMAANTQVSLRKMVPLLTFVKSQCISHSGWTGWVFTNQQNWNKIYTTTFSPQALLKNKVSCQ